MDLRRRRELISGWVEAGLVAVEPRRLTREAMEPSDDIDVAVIAVGKAAAAMCWGANDALGGISGICVTGANAPVPPGVTLVVGDHPVPGERSFEAGRRVLEVARNLSGRCVALISGGGSALCEHPRNGVDTSFLIHATRVLLDAGAPIDEMNLVRQHLSAIKCGGVAAVAPVPIESYVISDVGSGDLGVVASGPTIPSPADPELAERLMRRYGIDVDDRVRAAMYSAPDRSQPSGPVTLLADGRTAGRAILRAAVDHDIPADMASRWIEGDLSDELTSFLESAPPGVRIGVGEPTLAVKGPGLGGRNTHAALLAATHLEGSNDVFMAFATDGADGRSNAAGAIVDGTTTGRGGDPLPALEQFDSARYLADTHDLVTTGPSGTNVADVWVLWRA